MYGGKVLTPYAVRRITIIARSACSWTFKSLKTFKPPSWRCLSYHIVKSEKRLRRISARVCAWDAWRNHDYVIRSLEDENHRDIASRREHDIVRTTKTLVRFVKHWIPSRPRGIPCSKTSFSTNHTVELTSVETCNVFFGSGTEVFHDLSPHAYGYSSDFVPDASFEGLGSAARTLLILSVPRGEKSQAVGIARGP